MAGIENPLLLDLPVPIRTKRLTLRPPQPGDGAAMFDAVSESLAELQPYLRWATPAPTLGQREEYARQFAANFILRENLAFTIWQNSRFIGICELHHFNWKIPSAYTGYWLRTSESGKGYMTEGVNALSLYGFRELGLRRLVIRCDDDNTKSAGVPERLGFALESTSQNDALKPNSSDLRTTRTYVRFNADGLSDEDISWGA